MGRLVGPDRLAALARKGHHTWLDTGAGLDLTTHERWKVADRHILRLEGLDVAVKVPAAVWEKSG